MNTRDKVIVETRKNKTSGALEFSPLAISLGGQTPHTTAISYEGEDRRWYDTFEAADKIARDFRDGPGDDVRSAYWNNDTCEWEVAWWNRSSYLGVRISSGREDFHVDG